MIKVKLLVGQYNGVEGYIKGYTGNMTKIVIENDLLLVYEEEYVVIGEVK
jgi:hypothetical protein